MIRDYSIYEMSVREKLLFHTTGYVCICIVVYLFYHSVVLALVSGFLVIRLRPFYKKHMANRRMQALEIQFRDLLYSVSASVAAGRHMSEALVEAVDNLSVMYTETDPIMTELLHMKKSIVENNESDSILLSDFARRSGNEDINNFVQVYITCRSMGGDLEKIISRTSTMISDKMKIQREIRSITSQKKLEGRIIAAMPVAMLLVLNLLSPSYISPLYNCLAGRFLMTGALGTTVFGVWLMERISSVEI